MKERPYELVETLRKEVEEDTTLHMQVSGLVHSFLRYLKEPRYQSPLAIDELANLFQVFYKDLESVVVSLYGQSNSVKRQLISGSRYFREHPGEFDYLLAIASYSSSSIKLSRRTDPDAMRQLRIFSFYKLIWILRTIEQAHIRLLNTVNGGESISLFDKIFRFNQRDILHQEFLDNKIRALKALKLPFRSFYESDEDSLIEAIDGLLADPLTEMNEQLEQLTKNITPLSKLRNIVALQKRLMRLLADRLGNQAINNDVILPSMIYLLVYKLEAEDLYLNFVYIKKFLHLIDPNDIELSSVNASSTYSPNDRLNKATFNKSKKSSLFEVLNISDKPSAGEPTDKSANNDSFFHTNTELLHYIQANIINNGELEFYLTNYEAVLVFLSSLKLKELAPEIETSNSLLLSNIDDLVETEIVSQFEFPEGDITSTDNEEKTKSENRSRSSSLINSISQAFNENRTRSNSSILSGLKSSNGNGREKFPTLTSTELDEHGLASEEAENGSSFAMMRSIIGRLSSVSVSHLRYTEDLASDAQAAEDSSSPSKKTALSTARLSPDHSRTRSLSLENGTATPNTHMKRPSITSKFTNGVSDFMTKLNSNSQLNAIGKSISHSSLHSLEASRNPELQENGSVVPKRPDELRSRTTSLQVMDKWFNNIGENAENSEVKSAVDMLTDLSRFKNIEFENLSIRDLYDLKVCYDKLCALMVTGETDGDIDKTINASS